MHDDQEKARQDWRIPEAVWKRIEPQGDRINLKVLPSL